METNSTEGKRDRRGFLYKSERERRKDDSAYLYYYAQNGSDDDEDFEADSNELAENDEFDEDFQIEDKKKRKRRKVRRNMKDKEDNDGDNDRESDNDYEENKTKKKKKKGSKSKPKQTHKIISKKTINNSSAKQDKRKRKRKMNQDNSDSDENYDGDENDSDYEPVRKPRKLRKQLKIEDDPKEIQEDITKQSEEEDEKAAGEGISTQTLPPKQSVFLVEPQQGNNLCEVFQGCQIEMIDSEIFKNSQLAKEAFN